MRTQLTWLRGLLVVQLLSFWPVWKWYVLRMTDGSDEPWGVLPLVTCVVFCRQSNPGRDVDRVNLLIPTLLTVLYAVSYPFAPKLILAAIAVMASGSLICRLRFGTYRHAAFFGLLLLSLPVMASLQFYLGYPLRVVSGAIASGLLRMSGLSVVLEGTSLRWGTDLVAIDAPCSGVRMLWAGVYLALAAAFHLRLSNFRTASAAALSVGAVLMGNGIRSAALFHMETGIIALPHWYHAAIGLVAFAGTALVIVWAVTRMAGGPRWVSASSS